MASHRQITLAFACYSMGTGCVMMLGASSCLSAIAVDIGMTTDLAKGLFLKFLHVEFRGRKSALRVVGRSVGLSLPDVDQLLGASVRFDSDRPVDRLMAGDCRWCNYGLWARYDVSADDCTCVTFTLRTGSVLPVSSIRAGMLV